MKVGISSLRLEGPVRAGLPVNPIAEGLPLQDAAEPRPANGGESAHGSEGNAPAPGGEAGPGPFRRRRSGSSGSEVAALACLVAEDRGVTDYAKAVAEGRRLLRRTEEDCWRFAELSASVVGTGVSQRRWGADVGVTQAYVSLLVRTWARFSELPTSERPRWPDALETVRERSETVVSASEERDRRYKRQILKRPLEERVSLTRELLGDREVAREIGPKESQAHETAPRAKPPPADPFEIAAEKLSRARRLVEGAVEEIQDVKLTEEERAGLLVLVAEIEAAARPLRETGAQKLQAV